MTIKGEGLDREGGLATGDIQPHESRKRGDANQSSRITEILSWNSHRSVSRASNLNCFQPVRG